MSQGEAASVFALMIIKTSIKKMQGLSFLKTFNKFDLEEIGVYTE